MNLLGQIYNITASLAIFSVMGFLISYRYIKKLKNENRLAYVSGLESQTENILEHIISTTIADRALFIQVKNSGGKILAGVNKYATVLHEAIENNVTPMKGTFTGQYIGKRDMMHLHKLASEHILILEVSKMEPSVFSRALEAGGMTGAVFFEIKYTEKAFYYASFSTKSNFNEFLDSEHFSKMEMEINNLRNLYKKAAKKNLLY